MKLISLGLSAIPAPARAAAAAPDLREYGATGTSMFGGFLRDPGEYNSELSGLAAFPTYEKMRRSDAQVAATLAAMKLPIRGADWTVQAPSEATPVEKEAADFIRECLFEAIDWDDVVSNALLMLDFGCACHEDVYYIDGNRVRLKKLAARPASTFYRWLTKPGTEDLEAIEQYGELAGGGFGTATVPMNKAALYTFQLEGANWAGRSVLRGMYQHWYIKSNLYKIDAIAQERNGMGIPTITLAQDAKVEDRAAANTWVQQICAHERAGLAMPFGYTFGLEGVKGTLRDPKDSIAHHNVMISMAGLAQFLNLGQSESGNRALGESQTDFFGLSLEATAKQIGRVITQSTVRRLVDFNFGAEVRAPKVVAAQVLAVRLSVVVDALQKLGAAGFAAADPELEKWLRGKMGLPEVPAAAGAGAGAQGPGADEEQEGAADKAAVAAAAAGVAKTSGGGAGKDTPPAEKTAVKTGNGATVDGGRHITVDELRAAALSEADGLKLRRKPGTVGSEGARRAERCLALSEIAGELDRGRDAIAAALRAARPAVQAEAVQRLMSVRVRDMHRVAVPLPEKLVTQVEEILHGVYAFGVGQVKSERARQAAGQEPAGAAEIRLATLPLKKKKREPLGVYADGVVSEFINAVTSRAANVALDWMRRPGDLTKGEVIQRVTEELDGQSDKWIDGAAAKGANEAFADGRSDGYEEHRDEIQAVVYSALLDISTCENCAAADGAEGATPDDIPGAPNPDCDGGDRCRCVHVYVFGDEVRN